MLDDRIASQAATILQTLPSTGLNPMHNCAAPLLQLVAVAVSEHAHSDTRILPTFHMHGMSHAI